MFQSTTCIASKSNPPYSFKLKGKRPLSYAGKARNRFPKRFSLLGKFTMNGCMQTITEKCHCQVLLGHLLSFFVSFRKIGALILTPVYKICTCIMILCLFYYLNKATRSPEISRQQVQKLTPQLLFFYIYWI